MIDLLADPAAGLDRLGQPRGDAAAELPPHDRLLVDRARRLPVLRVPRRRPRPLPGGRLLPARLRADEPARVRGAPAGNDDDATRDRLDNLKGLFHRDPFAALMIGIAMLSLAGIPPFPGFVAKFLIFKNVMAAGYTMYAVLGLVGSYLGIYFYLRVIQYHVHEPGPSRGRGGRTRTPRAFRQRHLPGRDRRGRGVPRLGDELPLSVSRQRGPGVPGGEPRRPAGRPSGPVAATVRRYRICAHPVAHAGAASRIHAGGTAPIAEHHVRNPLAARTGSRRPAADARDRRRVVPGPAGARRHRPPGARARGVHRVAARAPAVRPRPDRGDPVSRRGAGRRRAAPAQVVLREPARVSRASPTASGSPRTASARASSSPTRPRWRRRSRAPTTGGGRPTSPA